MKIEEMGGEFALIDRLSAVIQTDHVDLIAGMGDDAAVMRTSPEPAPYLLATTDMLIEGRHFRSQWASAEQIGIKSAECNISDIAAMGGRPTWMFISLALTGDTDAQWVQQLYAGIDQSCRRHGVIVAGGDTTRGPVNTISITLLGTVSQGSLCLRSDARIDDLLMVTGTLGASAAAFALLEKGLSPSDYLLEKHLAPTSRMDAAASIAPLANAMIDISDGLGSEVHHICRSSSVDAEIYAHAIPLHDDVTNAAQRLQADPIEFAISGGEDYELLFSISEKNIGELDQTGITYHCVGKITPESKGPVLVVNGAIQPLSGGFNHFA